MSIQCDEELHLHMMEAGARFPLLNSISRAGDIDTLPDEALACLAEHSCEYLADQLAFSLISDEHRRVVVDLLTRVTRLSRSAKRPLFELPNFAEYFANWSLIKLFSRASFVADVEEAKSSLSFFCGKCRSLIITQSEVESPHYHGGHGPAFLAHRVFNCNHSADEGYETQFTTGVYRVCDVTCMHCGSRVGKKYLEARDPANFFKVGKILLEQTLLTMPKCCNNRKLNAFPPEHYYCSREPGVSHFCSICLNEVRGEIAAGVLAMTKNLDPDMTMKLYSILQTERQLFFATLSPPPSSLDDCSPISCSHSSISRRFGDAISRFVKKSFSPTASPTSCSERGTLDPIVGEHTDLHDPCLLRGRLDDEQSLLMSHCIGERVGMLPESQNWIQTTKFVNDVISSASRQSMLVTQTGSVGVSLSRPLVIEALVSQCGSISFPSVTLLLSRLPNVDDRRAVVTGVTKNEQAALSEQEMDSLRQLSGSPTSRWSSSFTSGSATHRY
jgi:hypothetical protein